MKQTQLDLAFGGQGSLTEHTSNFLNFLQEICEVFQVQIVHLIPVGPGGGWPCITVRGTEENIKKLLIAHYDGSGMMDDDPGFFDEHMQDCDSEGFSVFADDRFTTAGNRVFITEGENPMFNGTY
jgi:hypothetical protein